MGARFAGARRMPLQSATPAPALLDGLLDRAGYANDPRPSCLIFLRSDCPWCASEVPRLSDVFARLDRLEIRFIGVACGHDSSVDAARFGSEKKLSFPVVTDEGGALVHAFAIERVPSVVIISASSLVERTFVGVTEQLAGIVEQTLFAVAGDATAPDYSMIGNGCAPL